MIGFKCDDCGDETQDENDHIVTDDGLYLCLKCAEALKAQQEKCERVRQLMTKALGNQGIL